ncbi:GNAT family N-acetyltransferase [Flaviaesturariibacter flavus]|uniref:GNAT family N-acetyltransferase n=1 Tax=Flaviaesturariibacter flavus TaxID=2502780 RepID=A0A4R1BMI2_9BACT|nr:GNAT family N-acetyltransferase [Flaviaesturariibacter flavus]TCJ18663.1 GNAT family N-acetyltransferase [Flaviaesturariibacter flavus]
MNISWLLKPFAELTPHELYAILRLRNAVFVVEQDCVFQDADDKDQGSWHLMGWQNGLLAAYTRLVPPGLAYPEPSIGRVVSDPSVRRGGIGRLLMTESIRRCQELFGAGPIRIGAQRYLEDFYGSLGFQTEGEPYLEDGIPHVYMVRRG